MQLRHQLLPTQPINVWTSGSVIVDISNQVQDSISNWMVNDRININRMPDAYSSLEEQDESSDFEKSMSELLKDGLVTLDYIQDLFQQEQMFKDNFERIQKNFPDKYIVVCGEEIFVGETLKDAEANAYEKYKDRPTYSYSPIAEL